MLGIGPHLFSIGPALARVVAEAPRCLRIGLDVGQLCATTGAAFVATCSIDLARSAGPSRCARTLARCTEYARGIVRRRASGVDTERHDVSSGAVGRVDTARGECDSDAAYDDER
eukprot:444714-Pyramimonas_sp.AAC.2